MQKMDYHFPRVLKYCSRNEINERNLGDEGIGKK
jgi:hypothetical protein